MTEEVKETTEETTSQEPDYSEMSIREELEARSKDLGLDELDHIPDTAPVEEKPEEKPEEKKPDETTPSDQTQDFKLPTWPKEEQAAFDALPDILKKQFTEHYKKVQSSASRQAHQYTQEIRKNQEFSQAVAPLVELHSQGWDSLTQELSQATGQQIQPMALQSIAYQTMETLIRGTDEEKVQVVFDMIKGWGVPHPDFLKTDEGKQAVHNQQQQRLTRQQQQLAQQQQYGQNSVQLQQKTQNYSQQLTAFADKKDDKGVPLYPHFKEVASTIADMIELRATKGQPVGKMDELYKEALWHNPSVREKLQKEQQQTQKQKNAIGSISGSSEIKPFDYKNMSIRQELESRADSMGIKWD